MTRPLRWTVTFAATIGAFLLCLWLGHSVSFGWLPRADSDRWALAAAFAAVCAGVVGAAVGWWAGQSEPAPAVRRDHRVTQTAKASGRARTLQVGGSQTAPDAPAPQAGDEASVVRQEADASGHAEVRQIGRDQHLPGT